MLDHNIEELHDHLRGRPDEHLALAALLGVVDRLQGVSQDVHADHGERFGCGVVPESEENGQNTRNKYTISKSGS